MYNKLMLRRKLQAYIPSATHVTNHTSMDYIQVASVEFAQLGYVLHPDLVSELSQMEITAFQAWYLESINVLKEAKGVRHYAPMYPNFPNQVHEADELELLVNAIIHYVTGALPMYEKDERLPLFEGTEMQFIHVTDPVAIGKMFQMLMMSATSLSAEDVADLQFFLGNAPHPEAVFPEAIPHKEVLATVAVALMKRDKAVLVERYFSTATDVLRLAVAMSGGDVSLAKKGKFRNFSRPERRAILALLESCGQIKEDMWIKRGKWLRLGEKLHPGDYPTYSSVNSAFDAIRNHKVRTFNSMVESAISSSNVQQVLSLLTQRPGLFARRMMEVLRIAGDDVERGFILTAFAGVAAQISTPVLLQLQAYVQQGPLTHRAFMPKGQVAKLDIIKNDQLWPAGTDRLDTVLSQVLALKTSKLPDLGKVYLSEAMYNYAVPLTQRVASKMLHTIARGSVLPIGKNTMRLFIYWKDGEQRTDLDLSVGMFDENWTRIDYVDYTHMRGSVVLSAHSGDITGASHGASEFIDIDLASAMEKGAKYIVPNILNYTSTKFADLPIAYMGWMERTHVQSGEIYDPKTVINKVDLTADMRNAFPFVVTLSKDGHALKWVDLSFSSNVVYNNITENGATIAEISAAMVEKKYPNLGELLEVHATVRGQLVPNKEDADIVFDVADADMTPYDTERIMSEFLS